MTAGTAAAADVMDAAAVADAAETEEAAMEERPDLDFQVTSVM